MPEPLAPPARPSLPRPSRPPGRLPSPSLPLLWFGFAHLALAAAALALVAAPESFAGFYYHPRLLAVVHLVTLGWITSSVFGALYVLLPAVLRSPVVTGWPDHAAFATFAVGVAGMVSHFWLDELHGMAWSAGMVVTALVALVARLGPPLARSRVPAAVRAHLLLAVGNLLLAGVLGLAMGIHKQAPFLPVSSFQGALGHGHLAAVGFVVMMVAGAGYRLFPMFLPAAMPTGRALWGSAVLLQAGALGLAAGFLAPASGLLPVAAGLAVAGTLWFLVQVARIQRQPRPAPPALRRPDLGMAQALSALGWGAVAAGLGLALAVAPPAAWKLPAAAVYGVAGLLGFLAQVAAGIGHRLLPLYLWLREGPGKGRMDSPFHPLALPSRRAQALAVAGWAVATPLLAWGLAAGRPVAVAAAGVGLLVGGGAGAWTHGDALRRARTSGPPQAPSSAR